MGSISKLLQQNHHYLINPLSIPTHSQLFMQLLAHLDTLSSIKSEFNLFIILFDELILKTNTNHELILRNETTVKSTKIDDLLLVLYSTTKKKKKKKKKQKNFNSNCNNNDESNDNDSVRRE
eukprot:397494_1